MLADDTNTHGLCATRASQLKDEAGALLASNAKLEGVWRDYWPRASASSFALQSGAEGRPSNEGRRKAVAVVVDEAQAPLL